jgi:hypothetical protein
MRELKEHDAKMQKSCIESGVEYNGLYSSMNKKWNYVWVFEAEGYDHLLKMTQNVARPKHLTHYITELLLPIKL